jgi:hypothetical protein
MSTGIASWQMKTLAALLWTGGADETAAACISAIRRA